MENLNKIGPVEWDIFESLTSVYPNDLLGRQIVINGDVKSSSREGLQTRWVRFQAKDLPINAGA